MSAVTWDTTGGWDVRVAGLAADVDRVADRLRSLSQARLLAPVPGHPSRVDAARAAAQALVEVAQGVEEGAADGAPVWRDLPRLGELAVGDQVAVTGHDAVAACAAAGPDGPGWDRGGRATADVLLARATEAVRALRGTL
jgi:hypothetical protein